MGCGGAGGDLFEAAEGLVDCFGVGEGVEEVGCEEDEVGARLHLRVVMPRTPLLKSRPGRGASGSSSVSFFILLSLPLRRQSGSDESDAGPDLNVNDKEQAIAR